MRWTNALVVLALTQMAPAQNLLPDPGFEFGSVPGCQCAQSCNTCTAPISTWTLIPVQGPGGFETFSVNCLAAPGRLTNCGGQFASVTSAAEGLRFVAAFGGSGGAAFGCALASPLTPGVLYTLRGSFVLSNNWPGNYGYDVFVGSGLGLAANQHVGGIGRSAVTTTWTTSTLEFEAPPGATHIAFVPRRPASTNYSYVGCDALSLAARSPGVGFFSLAGGSRGARGWIGRLLASGTPTSGSLVGFRLEYVESTGPSVLVVGASRIDLPFAGAVLIPAADILLPMSKSGNFASLSVTLPTLPVGAQLFYQAWTVDSSGPHGLSASNGLMSISP